jgi:hypothetical protein
MFAGTQQKSMDSIEDAKFLQGGQNFLGLPRPDQSSFILCILPHLGQTHSTVIPSQNSNSTGLSCSALRQGFLLAAGISFSLMLR